jgi:nucleotide-binding universal stress UspA family protein
MGRAWNDIAVFLDASPVGEKLGRQAAELARRHNAHLVGVYGLSRDVETTAFDAYARGEAAIDQVLERHSLSNKLKVLAAERRFSGLSRDYRVSAEFRVVWREQPYDGSVLRALDCDLLVSAHPRPNDQPWSADRLSVVTGTPVLLIPNSWTGEVVGDNVLIGWNRSSQARRAVADAMPFIRATRTNTILIVNSQRNPEHFGTNAGANLLQHLERHDAEAEVVHVSSDGEAIADVIIREAAKRNANLLVIGAYSRKRTTELLFGGVTRSLLTKARIPMLISR